MFILLYSLQFGQCQVL